MIDFREYGEDNLHFIDITWEDLMDGYQHDVTGFASPARPYAREALTIFSFVPNPELTILFQCTDESMEQDKVEEKDLVFVDTIFQGHTLASLMGKLVVVIFRGFVTLRKVAIDEKGRFVLRSNSPLSESYVVGENDYLEVVGKVVQVVKFFE